MSDWWNRNGRAIKDCWPLLVIVAIPFLLTLPNTLVLFIEQVILR